MIFKFFRDFFKGAPSVARANDDLTSVQLNYLNNWYELSHEDKIYTLGAIRERTYDFVSENLGKGPEEMGHWSEYLADAKLRVNGESLTYERYEALKEEVYYGYVRCVLTDISARGVTTVTDAKNVHGVGIILRDLFPTSAFRIDWNKVAVKKETGAPFVQEDFDQAVSAAYEIKEARSPAFSRFFSH